MKRKLKELYENEITVKLQNEFSYANKHQIPKLSMIVINTGVGEAAADSKIINQAKNDLRLISGQEPIITKAKKSIATFKLREGMSIGCKVTLRRDRMYDFLYRLILVALPRIREFKGFSSKSFDGRGNFTFGIKEQTIFPEILYDKIDTTRGMDITIVTTATSDKEGKALLSEFLPFYN